MPVYRSYIQGPRWAGLPTFIKNAAFMNSLSVQIDIDKGFLRETVRFEIEGPIDRINAFKAAIQAAIQDYQEDRT